VSGIAEHVIEEVRERTDIIELIGEVVTLKKQGRNWVGLCPFHPEKTPSFNVTPSKQMYYCFGCQAGGNVFTFLMEHEKLEFPDAVRVLAERVGMEVPEERTAGPDPHAPLYRANRLAAEVYHRLLNESREGAAARRYLEGRSISEATREAFMLGWAPDAWETVIDEARRQGVDVETLAAAGLAARSEKTGGWYDRFRGRVVFPVRTPSGKIVAFSGRRLDDEEPKYLNSADSPVFTKGRTLYNLDLARGPIRRKAAAVVVEGNFDVVSLHQAGFRNVVAPLGTSFTIDQARTLKRYTRTAFLAYDGDAAGERSAFRAADLLLSVGFTARIVRLPDEVDPDTLVQEGGPGAFEEALASAADVVDEKIAIVKERVDLSDVPRKRRAIHRLLGSVRMVPDPVTRGLYVEKIAAELHVPVETLTLPDASGGSAARRPRDRARRTPAERTPLPRVQDERYLLLHALEDRRWREEAVAEVDPEFFTVTEYGEVFRRIADAEPGDEELGDRLAGATESGVARVAAELELWREEQGVQLSDEAFRDSLRRMLTKALERGILDPAPEGKGLENALRRRKLAREIQRGRLRPRRTDEPSG